MGASKKSDGQALCCAVGLAAVSSVDSVFVHIDGIQVTPRNQILALLITIFSSISCWPD
jgi:hypothetical protein